MLATAELVSLNTGLTDNQKDRIDALERNELFSRVKTVLLADDSKKMWLYGGTAQLVSLDEPLRDMDFMVVAEDLRTKGSFLEPVYDIEKNADIDLMVEEIGDVGLLREALTNVLGDEFKVVASGLQDYPRIDILRNGVEVLSVSDLKSSAEFVRTLNQELGIKDEGSDIEVYCRAKLLKNDQELVLFTKNNVEVEMLSGREWATRLIEINENSIFRPEVAQTLFESGQVDMGNVVMREWAYNVGKVAVMAQFGMVMEPETQEQWRTEVINNRNWVRENPEAMRAFSKRILKAANGNFTWFAQACEKFGLLSWFSDDLQNEFNKLNFNKLVERMNDADQEMFAANLASMDDFVDIILDESNSINKEKIKEEFTSRWNPGNIDSVAFAGGRKIKV